MKIEKLVLEGARIRLEPLSEAHRDGLASAIEDGELWKLPVTIVPHPRDLAGFFADAERAFTEGRELAFAAIDEATGRVAGSTRFRDIERAHRRVEIGFTFWAASLQRSHVNTEAKLLMLSHAFESWQVERVQLLTDERNAKSRAAIARIGAKQEGILRSHMIMRDGFVRNSVMFSVVRGEWGDVKRGLMEKMAGY